MAALSTEQAVQAIELESFVEKIADLQEHFNKLQTRLERDGNKVQCSNQTARGGVARAPFWVPTRVQGGAGIQQFAADTTGTVASWPRGSASQYVSFAASPIRLINVCEISNLSIEATSDKERGLVKFSREEMDKTLLAFENGREALLNSDGTGTLDVISATAVVSNNTGTGAQTSSITNMANAARFVDQQGILVFSAGGTQRTGGITVALISYVDPVNQILYFSTALPTGTTNTDLLVIQGGTGVAGSSIFGQKYWINNSNTGTRAGVTVSNYPGRFQTPVINFNNSGSLVNSTRQRVESIRKRALGDDYDGNEKSFWYTNYQQGVALADQFYNPGYTRLDEGGNKTIPDLARKNMQDTWGGTEVVYSSTADPTRMDLFVPGDWYKGELFPTRLHEWTPGNPIAAVPTNDGTGTTTYFDSQMFAYECGEQWICNNSKAQFSIQGLPVPANS
jgi:hypothetical protein